MYSTYMYNIRTCTQYNYYAYSHIILPHCSRTVYVRTYASVDSNKLMTTKLTAFSLILSCPLSALAVSPVSVCLHPSRSYENISYVRTYVHQLHVNV